MADESFKEFVLDQLARLPELRAKAMFGGHGLYQGEHFFGIMMAGRLYFKTDAKSRAVYREAAMEPFIYEKGQRIVSDEYYEVLPGVLEDRNELLEWAKRAVRAARPRKKRSSGRRT